jgi:L-alanine-DL-glutamate epimerase-like enolase superfamily enzyme
LLHDCGQLIRGWDAHPAVVWDKLWRSLHEAGGGGITTLAMAAVDTALWDLLLRASGESLVSRLGRRRDQVRTYGSGINYDYDQDALREQTIRWVAHGYDAVKIKVGHPSLEDDVRRCSIVREAIGPHRRLMIDANQRWNLDQATQAIEALSEFDLHWVEEPILADDAEGYARLRKRVGATIAAGENHRTIFEFRRMILFGACDVIQPNIARVGGLTPFLRIADLASAHGIRVCPHHLPEVSAQVALCLPEEELIECIEDSSFGELGIVAPIESIGAGSQSWTGFNGPGLGFEFDFERLSRFELNLAG